MLKLVADFLVKLTNLVEAEGRLLRAIVGRVAVGIGLLLLAMILLAGAAGLFVVAMHGALAPHVGPAGAAAICGVVVLGLAGGVLFAARKNLQ